MQEARLAADYFRHSPRTERERGHFGRLVAPVLPGVTRTVLNEHVMLVQHFFSAVVENDADLAFEDQYIVDGVSGMRASHPAVALHVDLWIQALELLGGFRRIE